MGELGGSLFRGFTVIIVLYLVLGCQFQLPPVTPWARQEGPPTSSHPLALIHSGKCERRGPASCDLGPAKPLGYAYCIAAKRIINKQTDPMS